MVQLFISHSERDEAIVRPLAGWLQGSLGLADNEIRCTSVKNMAVGAIAAEALRQDIMSAKAVVGLITANSLRSQWVQLEMGAGWLQQQLHTIRGPGVDPLDVPPPLSGFTSVGYCERDAMHDLLEQLAALLGTSPHETAREQFDTIARSAEQMLLDDRVAWFSLPPVLSAWRIESERSGGSRFEHEFQSLLAALNLQEQELQGCARSDGVLTRDPEHIPMWAMDLWTLSKKVVNRMLSPPPTGSTRIDVPHSVLPPALVARMNRALSSRKDRAARIRAWFDESRDWIAENPPSERGSHHARTVQG